MGQPLVWAPHTKQRVAAYPQYTYILGVDSPTPIVQGTHVQHGTLLPPVGCSVHQNINWKRKVTSSSQSNQIFKPFIPDNCLTIVEHVSHFTIESLALKHTQRKTQILSTKIVDHTKWNMYFAS